MGNRVVEQIEEIRGDKKKNYTNLTNVAGDGVEQFHSEFDKLVESHKLLKGKNFKQ